MPPWFLFERIYLLLDLNVRTSLSLNKPHCMQIHLIYTELVCFVVLQRQYTYNMLILEGGKHFDRFSI